MGLSFLTNHTPNLSGHETRAKSVWEIIFQFFNAPLGGKIRSKMAPVHKNFLKVAEIKNNFFFETQKATTTPTFCKRNFFRMHHIKNMNFLSFRLRLGRRRFVLKHHVNKNIFKNKVGIGYMYAK